MPELPYDDQQLEQLSRILRSLARRLVLDDESADDLVQEAWLAALAQPPERIRDLTGWLRSVLRRLAVRHHTRRARQREIEEWAAPGESVEGVDELAQRLSSIRMLQSSAEGLAEPYRTVIRLKYFEEMTLIEIAKQLERSSETVKSQLQRGLQKMRDQLDGDFRGDRRAWAATLLAGLDDGSAAPEASGMASSPPPGTSIGKPGPPVRLVGAGALALIAIMTAVYVSSDDAHLTQQAERAEMAESRARERPQPSALKTERIALDHETETQAPPAQILREAGVYHVAIDVVDSNGAPVAAARVERTSGVTETCDGSGHAQLRIEPADWQRAANGTQEVIVVARAVGHAESFSYHIARPPDDTPAPPFELRIDLRAPEVVVELEIVDALGQPVRDAEAYVYGAMVQDIGVETGISRSEPKLRIQMPDSGRAHIENLAQVERVYEITAPGFAMLRHVEPARGESLRTLRLELSRGASLSGVVRDLDGSPLAGARVWTDVGPGLGRNPAQTRSDTAGNYLLEGLDPGHHFLFACDPNDVEWSAHLELEVAAGEALQWNAQLAPRAGVRIRCQYPDGTPLMNSAVILRPAGEHFDDWVALGYTAPDGRLTLRPVPDGPLYLAVLGADHDQTLEPVLVVHDWLPAFEERVLEVEEREIPEGRVSGVFLDADGEVPIDAHLRLEDVDSTYHRRATPDREGAFLLTNVPEGRYELIGHLGAWGLAHLGTVHVEPAGIVDLGVVKAPPRSVLEIDWRWPSEEPSRITIQSGAWFPDRRDAWRWQPIMEGAAGPLPERLELLPGRHCIIVERPGEPPQQRFTFLEAEPLRVVFGPERVFVQTFRFVTPHGVPGGVDVIIGRIAPDQMTPTLEALDLALLEIIEERRVDPQAARPLEVEFELPAGHYLLEAFSSDGRSSRRILALDDSWTTQSRIDVTFADR